MSEIQNTINGLKQRRTEGDISLKEYINALTDLFTCSTEEDAIVAAEAVKGVTALCIERIMRRLIETAPETPKSEATYQIMSAICTISESAMVPVSGALKAFIDDEQFRRAYAIEFIGLTVLSAATVLEVTASRETLIAAIDQNLQQAAAL